MIKFRQFLTHLGHIIAFLPFSVTQLMLKLQLTRKTIIQVCNHQLFKLFLLVLGLLQLYCFGFTGELQICGQLVYLAMHLVKLFVILTAYPL